jgi:hypothetical protein
MTGITGLCHSETVRVAAAHQAEAAELAAELAAIAATGMVLPGSITQRRAVWVLSKPERSVPSASRHMACAV